MKTFTLKNKFQTNATLVANDFIDHYMVQANGEFVKVYLFLLRHLDNAGSSLTAVSYTHLDVYKRQLFCGADTSVARF